MQLAGDRTYGTSHEVFAGEASGLPVLGLRHNRVSFWAAIHFVLAAPITMVAFLCTSFGPIAEDLW
jgi:hypothetical protein